MNFLFIFYFFMLRIEKVEIWNLMIEVQFSAENYIAVGYKTPTKARLWYLKVKMENLICCIFTFCKILIITYNIKKILISIKKIIIKENLPSPILNCTTLFLICWMNEDPIIIFFFWSSIIRCCKYYLSIGK